jgi:hypothetical protein
MAEWPVRRLAAGCMYIHKYKLGWTSEPQERFQQLGHRTRVRSHPQVAPRDHVVAKEHRSKVREFRAHSIVGIYPFPSGIDDSGALKTTTYRCFLGKAWRRPNKCFKKLDECRTWFLIK